MQHRLNKRLLIQGKQKTTHKLPKLQAAEQIVNTQQNCFPPSRRCRPQTSSEFTFRILHLGAETTFNKGALKSLYLFIRER